MKQTKRAAFAIVALCLCASPMLGDNAKPEIVSAVESFATHPSQLTIGGTNLGVAKPTVILNGIPIVVLTFSNTKVVVQVPASLDAVPGTYALKLAKSARVQRTTTTRLQRPLLQRLEPSEPQDL